MRQALYRMSGVDVTQIDAIGVETVEVVLSEYGPDLSRFPTEKQFVSHVTLAPHVAKQRRQAAQKEKSGTAPARVWRPFCAWRRYRCGTARQRWEPTIVNRRRNGGDIAVFATARKLATLIYRLLRWGQPYVDEGAEAYEKRYEEACQKPDCRGQRPRLPTHSRKCLMSNEQERSHRPAFERGAAFEDEEVAELALAQPGQEPGKAIVPLQNGLGDTPSSMLLGQPVCEKRDVALRDHVCGMASSSSIPMLS